MLSTTAKVVADTVGALPEARITTFEIYAPRYILAEINTHRVVAKSAQSSRAIPVKKRIEMVRSDPFVPAVFGKNRPGMQSTETIGDTASRRAEASWRIVLQAALEQAETLDAVGVHKQQANRLLEPFAYFYGVLTATEWDNFWALRCHVDADPAFEDLARKMHAAYLASTPREDAHHLPYCDDVDRHIGTRTLLNISAARCARVSYKTFEGKISTPEDDAELCQKLLGSPPHLSPFDHPAIRDTMYTVRSGETYWSNPGEHRQFWGWIPYRAGIEKQLGVKCCRDSYDEILSTKLS